MAEPGKNGGGAATVKGYSLSVFLFVVGIVAVGLTILFSGFSKMPKTVLVSELLVLGCLVGLLIVSIVAKKRVESQYEQQERYPYTSVDKKSIENIFDIIADEEKKRQRLDAFAAGVDFQATQPARAQTQSSSSEKKEERPARSSTTSAADSPADSRDEADEDKPVIAVLDANEEEDSSDSPKTENDGEGSDEVRDNNDDRPRERSESSDRERMGAERRGPNPARRPAGSPPQKKRRPPYDPYYEDRYDQYGRPMRRRPPEPVYYDEYGRPIRRRQPEPVYYDEYGNPIRRRPQRDPYGAQPPRKKRRPPEGGAAAPSADAARKPAAENASGNPAAAPSKQAPTAVHSGPVAPVEMTPRQQQSRYSDEYIPVAIRDDEYVPAQKPTRVPHKGKPNPAPRHADYYEDAVDRSAPIVIPDDDYNPSYDDDAYAPPPRRAASATPHTQQRAPQREEYRPTYDEEEVVVVHSFDEDSYDESYEPQRGYQGGQQQVYTHAPAHDDGPYVPQYEDEDMVTVLPRDDGYDSYMEEKRAQERKEERRRKGKTALTIQKMRRRKIRRKSRRYKQFRCSVHTLTDYLNSYSSKTGRQ